MVRRLGLLAAFTIFAGSAFAQKELSLKTDTLAAAPRRAYHYIGIQANQLLRQLLNLGGGAGVVDNPYLLNYAVNSTKNGAGINLAVGYTVLETSDVQPTFKRESKDNSIFFRVGFDKKSFIGKRWLLGWGVDLVLDARKNNVKATTNNGGFESVSENKIETTSSGLGPRVTLNYHITDKILLGTEANYYLKSFKTETSDSFGGGLPNMTNTSKFKRFQLNVPAVVYLVVKL